jgi:2-keto-4-pentenoate hydratase/2-oxohepta-3-ene-1,7-dioic acid hydratase in catechol pathway
MTYRLLSYEAEGGPRGGLMIDGKVYDLERETGSASVLRALRAQKPFPGKPRSEPLNSPRLAAPLPDPGNIFCAGANYTDHMAEMARAQGQQPGPTMKDIGEKPWFFIKTQHSIVGPNAAVKLPPYSKAVDWEVELVAVIGKPAKDVPASRALDYVFGYTIGNDLSARDAIRREKNPPSGPFHFDWLSSKCFDGSCPLGPWIVPAAQIGDPQNLALKLWVGDELMQDSNTKQMIFTVAEQIEMLSSRLTLQPGDLIMTGTPAGVGMPRKRFLRAGEKVKLWIEKIGEFEHRMA